jgi:hypothetical protein
MPRMTAASPNVYVQDFRAGATRRQVSMQSGLDPNWQADGRELFYLSLDGTLMAVPVTPAPAFSVGRPIALFRFNPGAIHVPLHLYSATPDGQRFLVSETSGAPSTITAVHWRERLDGR